MGNEMRKLPKFTDKEIKYIYDTVMRSDTELETKPDYPFPSVMRSFTPFKNDLANKLTKYEHVLREQEYGKPNKII